MKTGGLGDQTISKPHSERVREAAMAQLEHLFFSGDGIFSLLQSVQIRWPGVLAMPLVGEAA